MIQAGISLYCKVKAKVNVDLCITPRCEHNSKVLRYGMRTQLPISVLTCIA